MWSKLKCLSEKPSICASLEIIREDGSISQDIKEILERWHHDISRLYSGLRDDPVFAFDDEFYNEIINVKKQFEQLSPDEQSDRSPLDSSSLNCAISYQEVLNAIDSLKCGKAYIYIPNDALKNNSAVCLLHKLFNICFSSGLWPTDWNYSVIKCIKKKI